MPSAAPADLRTQLARYLDPARLAHSESVADVAGRLARLHAPELEAQATLAGLLHDHAKPTAGDALLAEAASRGLPISALERAEPALLHGKVGAALLPERFSVDDAAVAQAVADHVTGRAGMPVLSQLLYVADQAAADRTFSGVEELRVLMLADLPAACRLVARRKIEHTAKKGRLLEPATVELYNTLTLEAAR